MTELVVDTKEDKQISGDGEGVEHEEVEEKDVSEGMFPVYDTKNRRENFFDLFSVSASGKGIKLDKELEQKKDVNVAMIPGDDIKKEEEKE